MRGRGRGRLAFLAESLAVVIGDSDGGCAGLLLHLERLGLFVGHGDDTRWLLRAAESDSAGASSWGQEGRRTRTRGRRSRNGAPTQKCGCHCQTRR
ncbi:hypothetical protein EV121DRAFT_262650 [Schizophyllum commune]